MTVLVLATLVLGIGLNAAIFSVVNTVLIRPLPIHDPDRIVWLTSTINRTGVPLGTSYPDFLDWKNQSRCFDAIAAMQTVSFTITGSGRAEHLKGMADSASGFKVWGVSTALGRDFTEQDDQPGAERVVILSHSFWQRRFGGDPNIVGQNLALDDFPYRVIGILQPTQINTLQLPDVWITNGPTLDQHIMMRDTRWFFPLARLKRDCTIERARAEMGSISSRLAAQYPEADKDMGVRVLSVSDLVNPSGSKPFLLLLIASSLTYLLAVANVTVVFLSDMTRRRQELSVRLALGSPRFTVIRQFFIYALMFAISGGLLGLLVAKLGLMFFLHNFPNAIPRFQETSIDFSVVAFMFGMALVATIAGTLTGAVYVSRVNINNELKGDGGWLTKQSSRAIGHGAFIFVEVALASALTLVSGLLIKSFYETQKVDLGFSPAQVISFQINLPPTRYKEASKQDAFFRAAVDKLSHLPGMESVSGISGLPLTNQGEINELRIEGQSVDGKDAIQVEYESILPGFFATMQVPLLQGRDFTEADHEGTSPVVIVDDVLAHKLWPGLSPLGKHLRMTGRAGGQVHNLEVIGVVREIKHFGPEAKVRWMQVYVPQYQDSSKSLSFVVKTATTDARPAIDNALRNLDKDLPVENFESMNSYLDTFLGSRKVSLLLLSAFAITGVGLGAIGIYGMVANSVTQRRRELAIRMAVGASAFDSVRLVTRLGLIATISGIAMGSVIVISLTRILASFLFGVSVFSPTIYLISASIILMLSVAASVIPAFPIFRLNVQQILRDNN